MQCDYFNNQRCRSCTLINVPFNDQLALKEKITRAALQEFKHIDWLEPFASPAEQYRNKAKMVIGGTSGNISFGILDHEGFGVDLSECGILSPGITAAIPAVRRMIGTARVTPYQVPARQGELKHVLITESPEQRLMIRFVLRSTEAIPRIKNQLPRLLSELPAALVVSANLLPEHKAVTEGEQEVLLSDIESLPMRINEITLQLRPQSFFQTNTVVAAALYREFQQWCGGTSGVIWDLYSGVGGFAMHAATMHAATASHTTGVPLRIIGVESSTEAVRSANLAAEQLVLKNKRTTIEFITGDAYNYARNSTFTNPSAKADLVIVNPPRRGIGIKLATWLETNRVPQVIYSSCNPKSLAADLALMPSLHPVRMRMFDMFPQTKHVEVLCHLKRTSS